MANWLLNITSTFFFRDEQSQVLFTSFYSPAWGWTGLLLPNPHVQAGELE